MNYFLLAPEVAGGLGPSSLLDRSVHPPRVSTLHYEFQGWLGDELLEAVATFIVTKSLKKKIERAGLSGVSFDVVTITTSDAFDELYPTVTLPSFVWMKITGKAGSDDFGMSKAHRLIVSQRALSILHTSTLNHADIEMQSHK